MLLVVIAGKVPFGDRPLEEITKADLVALVDRVIARGARVAANRLHEGLRVFFNWAISKDLMAESPAVGTEVARERFLNEDEVRCSGRRPRRSGRRSATCSG